MPLVSADPTVAFVDGVKAILSADATLTAMVTGIYGHVSEAARTAYPYLVLGRRRSDSASGAMGVGGGFVQLQIDGWSDAKGPYQITNIASRVYVLLFRQAVSIGSFGLVSGSVDRDFQEVFDEPDEDQPEQRLYRLVQLWRSEIHETA